MAAAAVESCSKCGKSPARFWCRDPSDARMAARACSLECAEDREGLQQHCGAAFFDGDYSVALKFRVSLRPNLTHDETDPFATSYLTCDVRAEPALAQTENFGERLWRRRQNSAGTKKTMDFVHEFRVSGRNFSRAALSADTSYCVQCFCQLQNHRDEPCSHRCGFAAFALRGMCEQYAATKKTLFWTTLRDHGPKFSSRGYVSVSLENPEALIKLVRGSENLISPPLADGIGALVGGPKSPGPVDALNAARGYYASITEVFAATAGPTDKGIRVPKLPIYTLSGGATMPSCAFIWFRQPPPIAEDYYANALMIALRRGNPFAAGDAALIEDFCKYSSSGEEWNAKVRFAKHKFP